MKHIKVSYRIFIVIGLMLIHLGVLAQSNTVTIRKGWSTPTSTTYWINSYPSAPTSIPKMNTGTSTDSWRNVHDGFQVKGDINYEQLITKTVALFNKSNKTPAEYSKLRDHANAWLISYNSPKDIRLRKFYRFHRMSHIFGDKEATILEDY